MSPAPPETNTSPTTMNVLPEDSSGYLFATFLLVSEFVEIIALADGAQHTTPLSRTILTSRETLNN